MRGSPADVVPTARITCTFRTPSLFRIRDEDQGKISIGTPFLAGLFSPKSFTDRTDRHGSYVPLHESNFQQENNPKRNKENNHRANSGTCLLVLVDVHRLEGVGFSGKVPSYKVSIDQPSPLLDHISPSKFSPTALGPGLQTAHPGRAGSFSVTHIFMRHTLKGLLFLR